VAVAWIFFRANTINDAWYIFTHLGQGMGEVFLKINRWGQGEDITGFRAVGLEKIEYLKNIVLLFLLECAHRLGHSDRIISWVSNRKVLVRWGFYYLILLLIVFWGEFSPSQFIYFQF
jgi:hypothetical protein